MRILVVLAFTLVFSTLASAQQTADQQFDLQRNLLRAQAKEAIDAEIARDKAGDCPGAHTDYDFNTCFGEAVARADQHLKTFEDALGAILALYETLDSSPPGPPAPGIGGPKRTSVQDAEEFSHLEKLWHTYLDAASAAASHQFDGETGAPSFELETHLRLVRNHMRELNMLYGIELRL
jgi:hypothetical protein